MHLPTAEETAEQLGIVVFRFEGRILSVPVLKGERFRYAAVRFAAYVEEPLGSLVFTYRWSKKPIGMNTKLNFRPEGEAIINIKAKSRTD